MTLFPDDTLFAGASLAPPPLPPSGLVWTWEADGTMNSPVAELVLKDGVVYGASSTGVFALQAETGAHLWTFGEKLSCLYAYTIALYVIYNKRAIAL